MSGLQLEDSRVVASVALPCPGEARGRNSVLGASARGGSPDGDFFCLASALAVLWAAFRGWAGRPGSSLSLSVNVP
jgi:hypothetical protein